jgi:predicted nucleic acid-binding Zn ribbon protein
LSDATDDVKPDSSAPDSSDAGSSEAGPRGTVDLPEVTRPADGLELARELARAASKAPAPERRRSSGSGSGSSPKPRRRRGKPGYSGAHPDDRDPQVLGSALQRLVGNRGWETDLKVQNVFGQWPKLVGSEIADHCTPEALVDGKLTVRTDSTAWATQLRLLAPSLVKRLNVELGHGTILVIDVLGPHVPSWKKGLRSSGGRGVRDTYG